MKLRFEQLQQHLQKELKPLYFLSGDEPLQLMEAAGMIRQRAKADGFTERDLLHAESKFDWNELLASANEMSLFAQRKIIDLRLPSGKPGDAGAKAMRAYAQRPSPDNLLLISSGKLERSQTKSKWYQALEQIGAVLELWPIDASQLPGWISRRLKEQGITITLPAASILAERVEGNLLAASQEMEKLKLLNPEKKHFDIAEIEEGVTDSSRYTVFTLTDAALAGDASRVTRILDGLQQEGLEAILVLWSLSREIRIVVKIQQQMQCGSSMGQAFSAAKVWDQRKSLIEKAMKRLPARHWEQLLMRCGLIDRMIKGNEQGNPWNELLQLALMMCGKRLV